MAYITRRSLMQGAAGLVVALHLPRAAVAGVSTVATDSVDAYLAVAPDGGVTVFAGKVDLGTGARAAIRQIVAEELSLSPERIALVEGDTALTPDQGPTGGSTGIMVWRCADLASCGDGAGAIEQTRRSAAPVPGERSGDARRRGCGPRQRRGGELFSADRWWGF